MGFIDRLQVARLPGRWPTTPCRRRPFDELPPALPGRSTTVRLTRAALQSTAMMSTPAVLAADSSIISEAAPSELGHRLRRVHARRLESERWQHAGRAAGLPLIGHWQPVAQPAAPAARAGRRRHRRGCCSPACPSRWWHQQPPSGPLCNWVPRVSGADAVAAAGQVGDAGAWWAAPRRLARVASDSSSSCW